MADPFELIQDELGGLTLRRAGCDDVKDVRVRRAFPWSAPTRYVSIRAADGGELLLIDDLEQLERSTRQLIEQWLESHSFIPKVTRVHRIETRFGYQQWRVETDRGPAEFRVQEREDIRFLGGGRFSVKDADGNIYELPNILKLDDASQRQIEALL